MQIEHVHRFRRRERVDGTRSTSFVPQVGVASGDPVQLVGRVQPQQIRDRFPLQDVCVHVDLVPEQAEPRQPPVRELERRLEALRARGGHVNEDRHLLVRERLIALDPQSDGRAESRGPQQHHARGTAECTPEETSPEMGPQPDRSPAKGPHPSHQERHAKQRERQCQQMEHANPPRGRLGYEVGGLRAPLEDRLA